MSENKQQQERKKKPWYRLRNILLVIFIAIISWPTYIVIWALNVEPNPSVDYALQMQALSIDNQPKGENGWPLLMEALSLVHEIEEPLSKEEDASHRLDYLDFDLIYELNTDEKEIAKLNLAIETFRSEGVFELLARAVECPNAVAPPRRSEKGPLFSGLLPELGYLRLLTYARIYSMNFAIEEGHYDEAVNAFDESMNIAKSLTQQPSLVEKSVGQHIAVEACMRLRIAISDHNIDSKTLSRFQDALLHHLPLGSLSIGIEFNRLLAYDTIQYTFSDNGRGNGRLLLSQFDEVGFMNVADISNPSWQPFGGRESFSEFINVTSIAYADRKETTDIVDRFFDGYIKQAKMTRKQRLANPFDDSEFMLLGWRHPVTTFLFFDLSRAFDKRDGVDCQIAGTSLMLAIEEYHAAKGQYPITLDNLVPEFLQEIPNDPFSAQGFIYRLTTDDSEQLSYELYSIGADGKDNNGLMDEEQEEAAFSSFDGEGFDFNFRSTKHHEK